MSRVEVVRTYLELVDPDALRSLAAPDASARVERVLGCPASFFRWLYVEVGRGYHWRDRLAWSDEQIRERLADPCVSLHLLSVAGSPPAISSSSVTLRTAASKSPTSVCCPSSWVVASASTSSRRRGGGVVARGLARVAAHLHARRPGRAPNYLARGFRPFRTETYEAELP